MISDDIRSFRTSPGHETGASHPWGDEPKGPKPSGENAAAETSRVFECGNNKIHQNMLLSGS